MGDVNRWVMGEGPGRRCRWAGGGGLAGWFCLWLSVGMRGGVNKWLMWVMDQGGAAGGRVVAAGGHMAG